MSKAITERPHGTEPAQRPPGWDAAPSVLRDDDVGSARYVGAAGVFFVLVGGLFLIANVYFHKSPFIGVGLSTFSLAVGIIALLYHAAFDRDVQFRRVYMAFSYAAMLVGAFLCVLKYPDNYGDQFQSGYLCLSLALLFLLAFLRNETDANTRMIGQRVLAGVGILMVAVGLIGGSVNNKFLLPIGFELGVLGFVYLAAFVGSRGTSDDQ